MGSASSFDRVVWIVLDGVGAGELPDAQRFGDLKSDSLGNLAREFKRKEGRSLVLPHLRKLGMANLTPMEGVAALTEAELLQNQESATAFGKAIEHSTGKDTTSGHWEMAGFVVKKTFQTFPEGFPKEIVDRWIRECKLSGVLGNCVASGTEIIEQWGAEHLKTGKPILYTSADSVWQVAAHEQSFGLERLLEICKVARTIGDELNISRVIARPFIGDPAQGVPFQRTYHRKDYAQLPEQKTILDYLVERQIPVLGIGKISNIFCGRGVTENLDTAGNVDGTRVLQEQLHVQKNGLIFCNLIDFDMLYGHRRDVRGYGLALEAFDQELPKILEALTERDLLVIASDHGNDPTYRGTDHTREYIPVLAFSPRKPHHAGSKNLGVLEGFADVGATILQALTQADPHRSFEAREVSPELAGRSFLKRLFA